MTRIAPPPVSTALSATLMTGSTGVGSLAAFTPAAGIDTSPCPASFAVAKRVVARRVVGGEVDDAGEDALRDPRDIDAHDVPAMRHDGRFDATEVR